MKKVLIVIITIITMIILITIQAYLLNELTILGIASNIGIVFVCALGIASGSFVGATSGAFYGLFVDIMFGKALGFFLLLYLLIGILAGYLKSTISKENKYALSVMVFIGTALFEIITCVFSTVLYKTNLDLIYLVKVIAIEEIYNMFLTFILYRPFAFWGEYINRSRDSYYLLH